MKKNIAICLILLSLCVSVFAKHVVLERDVNNHVERYYDKTWFSEQGKVRIHLNEFSTADGKRKFGWAYAIESDIVDTLADSSLIALAGEDECPLMYYVANGKFYIGYVWTGSYETEIIPVHSFYEFDEKDGYDIYFMFAYASAVDYTLTYGNSIHFREVYDNKGISKFTTGETPELSFRTSDFPDYVKYSEYRVTNGCINGNKVWLDGEWRDITRNPYKDQFGVLWESFTDITGFHVHCTESRYKDRWFEPAVLTFTFRTVDMVLVREMSNGSSETAGKKIFENLKKYGLWKSRECMYLGDGTTVGEWGPNEGIITCWYEPFMRYGNMQDGLKDVVQKDQLIDYQKVSVIRN